MHFQWTKQTCFCQFVSSSCRLEISAIILSELVKHETNIILTAHQNSMEFFSDFDIDFSFIIPNSFNKE